MLSEPLYGRVSLPLVTNRRGPSSYLRNLLQLHGDAARSSNRPRRSAAQTKEQDATRGESDASPRLLQVKDWSQVAPRT